MTSDSKILRRKAAYIIHLAANARDAGAGDTAASWEEIARDMIDTANRLDGLEDAIEIAMLYAGQIVAEAQTQDWYDAAYEGFCDGMAAARYADPVD